MDDIKNLPPVLKPHEVADILRVSPRQVRRLFHTNKLDGFQIGSAIRINRDSVERALNRED